MGDVICGLQGQAQRWTQQGVLWPAVMAEAEGASASLRQCLKTKAKFHTAAILLCSWPPQGKLRLPVEETFTNPAP